MSKLDDIELNQELLHSYSSGDVLTQQLSQFPESKQQIKDLMCEVFEQARDKGGRNEYELAEAFNEIVENL